MVVYGIDVFAIIKLIGMIKKINKQLKIKENKIFNLVEWIDIYLNVPPQLSSLHVYMSLIILLYYIIQNCFTERITDVAFTVSLTIGGSLANKKIIYDKIITNVGHGYSQQTGVFTCPKAGLYVFTWSTLSRGSSENCYAFIYRNGQKSLVSFSYENGGSGDEAASNTAVFHLSVGDRVWIQTTYCGWFHGYPYTAFSGWKLWTQITTDNMIAYLIYIWSMSL